jgi:hypothetical protein
MPTLTVPKPVAPAPFISAASAQRPDPALRPVLDDDCNRAPFSPAMAPMAFPLVPAAIPTGAVLSLKLLALLQSGKRLRITPDCTGGLLIVKRFYVDFAGPGAAIGGPFDQDCLAVYAIGTVRIQTPKTTAEREESLYTRIAYAERLSSILTIEAPLGRARLILMQLEQWLSPGLLAQVPPTLIAQLVCIPPITMQLVQQSTPKLLSE